MDKTKFNKSDQNFLTNLEGEGWSFKLDSMIPMEMRQPFYEYTPIKEYKLHTKSPNKVLGTLTGLSLHSIISQLKWYVIWGEH